MERKKGLDSLIWTAALLPAVAAVLFFIYRGADLHYPLGYYGDDGLGVFYVVKTIRDHGILLVNPDMGGMSGADMYDYPYGCFLPFILVKLISLFVSDIYLITNLFYFLCYMLSALFAFMVCRVLKLSAGSSFVCAILFAFSPFIQMRYTHMWLVPYFMMPFACLISVWIISGGIFKSGCKGELSGLSAGKSQTLSASEKKDIRAKKAGPKGSFKRFFICLFLAFAISWTGVYYAFFASALFAIAAVISMARTRRIRGSLYPLAFIASSAAGVLINILPTIIYTAKNGANPMSETARRGAFESELYGLKLTQLLLPRNGHRISFLASLKNYYNANSYFFNESTTASLGLISALAFVAAMILLMRGLIYKNEPAAYDPQGRIYASVPPLILGAYLVAESGGVGSLLAVFVSSPVRGYNRMSTTIIFLCLLLLAAWLDSLMGREKLKGAPMVILCLLITAVGLFDQTVDCGPGDHREIDNARVFAERIGQELPEGSYIFEYPYVDWPSGGSYRLFLGYLESDGLKFSFASMQGREEAIRQSELAALPAREMIKGIRKAGYSGLYLDLEACHTVAQASGLDDEAALTWAQDRKDEFIKVTGQEPIVSEDGKLCFFNLKEDE